MLERQSCGREEGPTVGVHRGQDVDVHVVDDVPDALLAVVLGTEVMDQVEGQLAPHHLVTMHVGDVLQLDLAGLVHV